MLYKHFPNYPLHIALCSSVLFVVDRIIFSV